MSAPIFVDANAFVYARDVDDVVRQPLARSWLEWLWQQELGRTSTQVLSEYYVTVTRKLKPGIPEHQARDDVEALIDGVRIRNPFRYSIQEASAEPCEVARPARRGKATKRPAR